MISLVLENYSIDVHLPDGAPSLLVYLHASREEGRAVWQLLPEPKPALAIISGTDWNRDFSPWPAEKIFANGENFSGGGEAWLSVLTGRIMPAVGGALPQPSAAQCIAGYSLAGLFALWCAYRCDTFDAVAALSPSLWFDGFTGFMAENAPGKRLKKISLSLGDREKHTRSKRMSVIGEAMRTACKRLEACGVDVCFRSESGGHFDDVPGRIARGIACLYAPASM